MTTMNSRGALRGRDGAECGHERAELAMVLDAPEALGGAQQAEPDPPPAHVAVAPALDVPRDVAQRPDEILDAVRRGEEAAQRRRDRCAPARSRAPSAAGGPPPRWPPDRPAAGRPGRTLGGRAARGRRGCAP